MLRSIFDPADIVHQVWPLAAPVAPRQDHPAPAARLLLAARFRRRSREQNAVDFMF